MATHSSILAWEIPWTEEPVGLQSLGSQYCRSLLVIHFKHRTMYLSKLPKHPFPSPFPPATISAADFLSDVPELGFPGGARGKKHTCLCRRHRRCGFDPWVGKILWSRKRLPAPVFLLKNPTDRETWRATICRVPESRTRLKPRSTHARTHA